MSNATTEPPSSAPEDTPTKPNNRNHSLIFIVLLVVVTGLSLLLIEGFIMKSVNHSREKDAKYEKVVQQTEDRLKMTFGLKVYPKMFTTNNQMKTGTPLDNLRNTLVSVSDLPKVIAAPVERGYVLTAMSPDGIIEPIAPDKCLVTLRRAQTQKAHASCIYRTSGDLYVAATLSYTPGENLFKVG